VLEPADAEGMVTLRSLLAEAEALARKKTPAGTEP
jgi:hypothetical protein